LASIKSVFWKLSRCASCVARYLQAISLTWSARSGKKLISCLQQTICFALSFMCYFNWHPFKIL
jgi:hypothetical protein